MALSVSTLVDYVIENEKLLVSKSLFSPRTSEIINAQGNIMVGVSFAEQINILATDAVFQDGTGCTRTPTGTTSITQRKVTVGDIVVVEDLCVSTLNKKYTSKMLANGSDINKLPFEQEFGDLKTATIAENLEIAIWQGNTDSAGDATNARFDGFIKLIDASAVAIPANTAALGVTGGPVSTSTGIIASNVVSIINAMWLGLPARLQGKSDVRIFCGWDVFYKYVAAYTALNLFAFAPKGNEVGAEGGEIVIPGTNYKLTAVHGLDGTSRLFSMRTSNMFAAVDLQNEEDTFKLMPDQFQNYLRFEAHFKYGVNIAFPAEVVSFKLT